MNRIFKTLLLVLFIALIIVSCVSCGDDSHVHTYADEWTSTTEKHWKNSTCGHQVKSDEGYHEFESGEISDNTHVIYTCVACGYQKIEDHVHNFGEWSLNTAPTIFESGEETRYCKHVGCTAFETNVIAKVDVESIFVKSMPTKTQYNEGDSFDKRGIVVIAVGVDESQTDVTDLIEIDKTILSGSDTAVTVSYSGVTAEILITVYSVDNHSHSYEGEWIIHSNATIFESGQKYRVCTFVGCDEKEYETIEAISVTEIIVTSMPTKTVYTSGEAFDSAGLVITAIGADASKNIVTDLVRFDKVYLTEGDTFVTATYASKNVLIYVTVYGLSNHTHAYEGEWTIAFPATIFENGQKYRVCSFNGCQEKEYDTIETISVSEIIVTSMPTKTVYMSGETFDSTGLVIIAIGADASENDVTDLVTFNKVNLSDGDTSITATYESKRVMIPITVYNLENHPHIYEGEWLTSTAPTIFQEGQVYRVCTVKGCDKREINTVPAIEITSISVKCAPDKRDYFSGESFDATGLVIIALGADKSQTVITSLVSFDKLTLVYGDTEVTATYLGKSCKIAVSVTRVCTVSEALTAINDDQTIVVEGIYVGIADEGFGYSKEMLLKDTSSDKLISIIGVTYGSFPNYGYQKGDLVRIVGILVKERYDASVSNSQNKTFINFSDTNPAGINDTIVSRGNKVTYNLEDAIEITSWAKMKEYFKPENAEAYTYIHVTGTVWFNTYTKAGDGVLLHRFAMNSSASSLVNIKPDGARAVGFRENVIQANTPSLMSSSLASAFGSTKYPGNEIAVEFYAVLTATNNVNYQLTILESSWLVSENGGDDDMITENDIVKEVAYAYYRQGSQIYYDQSWRAENCSPEDATSQNQLNLDCSSYVNSIYYEAFGHNILGVPLYTKSCNTANFVEYAKNNLGVSADVLGYWENADYPAVNDQKTLLSQIQASLEVGDVIVYRRGTTEETGGHTLIYVGNGKFLHSTGTKCTYSETSPDTSIDKCSTTEYKNGTIALLNASDLFTDTNNSRYLFKDGILRFCHLRPLALGLTTTKKSENRMKIAGVDAEKTVLPGLGAAVSKGETLTYTLTIKNYTSKNYTGVIFEEILSDNVEFVFGSPCLSLNGHTLRATLDIGGDANFTITWTVRVKSDAELGARIESKSTTLGGVNIFPTENYVSAYTSDQLVSIANKAKEIAGNSERYSDPIELAKAIYKEVLGADVFDANSTAELLESILTFRLGGTRYMVDETSEYADITVDKLCIGKGMSSTLPGKMSIVESDLAIGDLIFLEWSGNYRLYVYVGNNEFVKIDTLTGTASLVSGGEQAYLLNGSTYELKNLYNSLRSYTKCVVIRPSINNN